MFKAGIWYRSETGVWHAGGELNKATGELEDADRATCGATKLDVESASRLEEIDHSEPICGRFACSIENWPS